MATSRGMNGGADEDAPDEDDVSTNANNSTIVSVRLPRELALRIARMSRFLGWSRGRIARGALLEAIARLEKKHPAARKLQVHR